MVHNLSLDSVLNEQINGELVELNSSMVADVLCEMLQAREPTSSQFRVLSLGCGDADFDIKALKKTLERFPEAKFHYVGIDVGEASCQEARKSFESLRENVMANLFYEDVQKMEVGAFEPFDMVMCINLLYFVTSSLETVLSNCLKLLKVKGKR